jgi:hypothetical protein
MSLLGTRKDSILLTSSAQDRKNSVSSGEKSIIIHADVLEFISSILNHQSELYEEEDGPFVGVGLVQAGKRTKEQADLQFLLAQLLCALSKKESP